MTKPITISDSISDADIYRAWTILSGLIRFRRLRPPPETVLSIRTKIQESLDIDKENHDT